MAAHIYIGTSGWHYSDWLGRFYPHDVTGYKELAFHAQQFNTVENNSSFYRIAGAGAYKTWDRMTPAAYKFSIKLNRLITHVHRLRLNDEVRAAIHTILETTRILGQKRGAILIQLPASFGFNMQRLDEFLAYFTAQVRAQPDPFDVAIEFRNKHWFNDAVYALVAKYNVALVAGQSSSYPGVRRVTATVAYIRMHGPRKLFASSYSQDQLADWADYIASIARQVERIYVYFNNDFHGYALKNAKELDRIVHAP